MRSSLSSLTVFASALLMAGPSALADEGMWTPEQLAAMAAQLGRDGLSLPARKLADLSDGPLGSVIHLGGCTASFVSPDGLIVTNHHCAVGAIQFNSVEGPNLLEQGFTAKTRADERWAGPSARVLIARKQTDVTARFDKAIGKAEDDAAIFRAIDRLTKSLIATCERRQDARCRVASYDGGARWVLIDQLELRDVRLVHAPPRAVGTFGGDVDNWMWPRHTGDWSLFRAYVGKDGKAADHRADNVPYGPRRYLRVGQGVKPGDFVMVAGYPGRTYRYRTAAELAFVARDHFPWLRGLLGRLLTGLREVQARSRDAKVKLTSIEGGLANYEKYLHGLLDGFARSGVVAQRQREGAALTAWVKADEGRRKRFAGALRELDELQARGFAARRADQVLQWLFRLPVSLHTAGMLDWLSVERGKPDRERDAGYQTRDLKQLKGRMEQTFRSYVPAGDRVLLEALLGEAARLPAGGRIAGLDTFLARFADADDASPELGGGLRQEQVARAVAWLTGRPTVLAEAKTRAALFEAKPAALAKTGDRLLAFAKALHAERRAALERDHAREGALARLRPVTMAALRAHAARELYPDANGTLRVTWGHVRGYSPREAVTYAPRTTLAGVLEKDTGADPFDVPPALREAAEAVAAGKAASPFIDPGLGSVPVNFLSTVDTTGGNSGSPTLDAKGRLVGLLFDGNYESMASDWVFDKVQTRSIHVDVRYLLWSLHTVFGGARLVEEMTRDR